MSEQSVFTKIINGQIPAYKIYEDDRVIAFLDTHPVNSGHTLVVPKVQIDHVWDLNDDDYEYLWKVSRTIAGHIRQKIGSPRVGVVVEGFGVPHAHVHLIPIYSGNDVKTDQDMSLNPDHAKLAETAALLQM